MSSKLFRKRTFEDIEYDSSYIDNMQKLSIAADKSKQDAEPCLLNALLIMNLSALSRKKISSIDYCQFNENKLSRVANSEVLSKAKSEVLEYLGMKTKSASCSIKHPSSNTFGNEMVQFSAKDFEDTKLSIKIDSKFVVSSAILVEKINHKLIERMLDLFQSNSNHFGLFQYSYFIELQKKVNALLYRNALITNYINSYLHDNDFELETSFADYISNGGRLSQLSRDDPKYQKFDLQIMNTEYAAEPSHFMMELD